MSDAEFTQGNAFDIAVQVVDSIRIGAPIRIQAIIRARVNAPNAQLSITAPEVVLATQSGWSGRIAPIAGVRVAPVWKGSRSFSQGDAYQATATLNVLQPGYYRVVVNAIAAESPQIVSAELQGSVHKELWLLITESGGQVSDSFDPTLLPPGTSPAPGPFQQAPHTRVSSLPSASTVWHAANFEPNMHADARTSMTESDGNDYWRLVYYNQDDQNYDPMLFGSIEVNFYYDDGQGNGVLMSTDWLAPGPDGVFPVNCGWLTTGQWYEMTYHPATADVSIGVSNGFGLAGGNDWACGQDHTISSPGTAWAPSAESKVLTNLQTYIPSSRTFFGYSRGQIHVDVSTSGTGAEYQTANYFHSEQIEVYGTAIWGSYGKFAVVHEYGHALHNASLGGIPSVSGCSSHYVDGATNLSCAFVEGFADYHATALGASYFNFTTFDYSRECTSRDANGTCLAYSSTTGNGAKVEGGVASFLLHMTNGGPFQYPGNYVATLVRTCYGNFAHVDGVDYFTYCAEQRIDPSVASYFWERSQPANVTFQAGTPANWSASDIRARWLWDLFRVSP